VNDEKEKLVAAALAGAVIALICAAVFMGARPEVSLPIRQRWAADAGHAEFYLDEKTGEVEWRWKPMPTTYLTTGSGSLIMNPSPYWSTK